MLSNDQITEILAYTITKKSDLVQSWTYNMDVLNQKLINYFCSRIIPNMNFENDIYFNIKEFIEVFNYQNNGRIYREIHTYMDILQSENAISYIDESGNMKSTYFIKVKTSADGKALSILFNSDLKDYFVGVDKFFTSYKLGDIVKLKGKYSIKLYEIVLSLIYKKKPSNEIELDKLRRLLGCKNGKYKLYADFIKGALKPAIKELNAKSGLNIGFCPIKRGNKVSSIKFFYI